MNIYAIIETIRVFNVKLRPGELWEHKKSPKRGWP